MPKLKSAFNTTLYGTKGKTPTTASRENQDQQKDEIDNENSDFKTLLEQLKGAADKGFGELQQMCNSIKISSLKLDEEVDYSGNEFQSDAISEGLLPADTKKTGYRALKTMADGNCLFRSASIFAFGNQLRHEEMRVRTVLELALNSEFYQKGKDVDKISLAQMLEIYPEGGERRSKLSDNDVRREFESEVRNTTACNSWCGYWHLQALGTVLDRQIRSVYPDSGSNEIRKYFNAIICPRVSDPSKEPLTFMWTHTAGGDASKFRPNHFVPLIPGTFSRGPISEESGEAEKDSSGLKRVKEDDLVVDIICGDPSVLDEVCLKLDHPVGKLLCKYWPHLAHSLGVSEITRMQLQQKSGYQPSSRMFQYLSASLPDFTVDKLKGVFKSFERDDLVSMLEESSVEGTERLTALSQRDPKTFRDICLRLDCTGVYNWQDIGEEIGISVDTLETFQRPGGCTDLALQTIYTRRPQLSVGEMKDTIKEMSRVDVWEKLNVLPDKSTIQALLGNYKVLQEVTRLLDKKTPQTKNWRDFAQRFGLSKDECDYLEAFLSPDEYHSPTEMLMRHLSCAKPALKIHVFIDALRKIKRMDVVEASLKKFFNHIDIDMIVIKLRQLRSGETNEGGQQEQMGPLNLL